MKMRNCQVPFPTWRRYIHFLEQGVLPNLFNVCGRENSLRSSYYYYYYCFCISVSLMDDRRLWLEEEELYTECLFFTFFSLQRHCELVCLPGNSLDEQVLGPCSIHYTSITKKRIILWIPHNKMCCQWSHELVYYGW